MARRNQDTIDAAEELTMYANNTGELHEEYVRIVGHMKRRIYNKTTKNLWRLWEGWFQSAVWRYRREIGKEKDMEVPTFTMAAVRMAAHDLCRYTHYRILLGEFDGEYGAPMLTKEGTIHPDANHSFAVENPGDWFVVLPVMGSRDGEEVSTGPFPTESEAKAYFAAHVDNPVWVENGKIVQRPEVWG